MGYRSYYFQFSLSFFSFFSSLYTHDVVVVFLVLGGLLPKWAAI